MPSAKVSRALDCALRMRPQRRAKFVARVFRNDAAADRELRRLLLAADSAGTFLEGSAVEAARHLIGSSLSALELAVGETLGDFVIQRKLGSGAFGHVYLATQVSLSRTVALKVTPDVGHEGQAMAKLEHPNIVPVYSQHAFPDRGCRGLCMPYVPGTDLGTALADRRTLGSDTTASVLDIVIKLASALAYAHERGILHLDVKPANILITPQGEPLLADFSVSLDRTQARYRVLGGTDHYMSPEHSDALSSPDRNAELDARADVFSLGVVLKELLTLVTTEVGTSAARARLGDIVRLATEPDRNRRLASAADLVSALESCRELYALEKQIGTKRAAPPARLLPIAVVASTVPLVAAQLISPVQAVLFRAGLALIAILGAVALGTATRLRRPLASAGSERRARLWTLLFPVGMALITLLVLEVGIVRVLSAARASIDAGEPAERMARVLLALAGWGGAGAGLGFITLQWLTLAASYPALWLRSRAPVSIASSARRELNVAAVALKLHGLVGILLPFAFVLWLSPPWRLGAKAPFVGTALALFTASNAVAAFIGHLLLGNARRLFDSVPRRRA